MPKLFSKKAKFDNVKAPAGQQSLPILFNRTTCSKIHSGISLRFEAVTLFCDGFRAYIRSQDIKTTGNAKLRDTAVIPTQKRIPGFGGSYAA